MRSKAEDKVFHQVVMLFHFHEKQARSQGRVFPCTSTNNLLMHNIKIKDKKLLRWFQFIQLVSVQLRHEIKQISLKDLRRKHHYHPGFLSLRLVSLASVHYAANKQYLTYFSLSDFPV